MPIIYKISKESRVDYGPLNSDVALKRADMSFQLPQDPCVKLQT